jgi:hypothetical protein
VKYLILLSVFLSGCSLCDVGLNSQSRCYKYNQCKEQGKKLSADGAWCEDKK